MGCNKMARRATGEGVRKEEGRVEGDREEGNRGRNKERE